MSRLGEHTATIFAELRRIGVEPDLVGAPLIATGFTRRSLLEWLQRMPSGTGGEELQRRLEEHARHAVKVAERAGESLANDTSRVDQSPSYGQVKWWPTTLMLDAGIELLAEEWDPIGLRLGGMPAEDFGEYALHVFGPLLHTWHGEEPLAQVSMMIGAIERELGLRASPPIHRHYLAARLREIVARHPLPVRQPRPQVERLDESDEVSTPAARSWDDTVDFLRLVLTARNDPERGVEITHAILAELASEIAADADEMDGPVPDEIDLFLREYAPFEVPPASPSRQAPLRSAGDEGH